MTAADVLYGLAIVAGAFALVAAEDLLAAWARSRSMRAILGRRHAENTRGRAENPNAPGFQSRGAPNQRYAGPYIKAAGFGEAREIAERLTIGGATGSAVSVIGQLCDGEARPEPVAYAP